MTEHEKFLRTLAEKYNLPVSVIKLIIESPFRMLSDEMSVGNYTGTKYIGIGTFTSPEWKKQKWLLRQQEIKEEKRLKAEQKLKENEALTDTTHIGGLGVSSTPGVEPIESREAGGSQEETKSL